MGFCFSNDKERADGAVPAKRSGDVFAWNEMANNLNSLTHCHNRDLARRKIITRQHKAKK